MQTKRARLVEAARRVAYANGFSNTTVALVAADSGVPLGNVYYYFRTKEALGEALVDTLIEDHRKQRKQWERAPDPGKRLIAWIDAVEGQRAAVARYGCPVGSLCTELGKTSPSLRQRAGVVFTELLGFAEAQFRELGHGAAARERALHLLAAIEGAILLAHTFQDESVLLREARLLRKWVAEPAASRNGRSK